MLHILIRSPYVFDFQTLLRIVKKDEDELLLLSDGVIVGIHNSFTLNSLLTVKVPIYALKHDIIVRGLFDSISEVVCMINYIDFVRLTEKHCSCFSW